MCEFLSTLPPWKGFKYIVYKIILVIFYKEIYTCHVDLKLLRVHLVFMKQWI